MGGCTCPIEMYWGPKLPGGSTPGMSQIDSDQLLIMTGVGSPRFRTPRIWRGDPYLISIRYRSSSSVRVQKGSEKSQQTEL